MADRDAEHSEPAGPEPRGSEPRGPGAVDASASKVDVEVGRPALDPQHSHEAHHLHHTHSLQEHWQHPDWDPDPPASSAFTLVRRLCGWHLAEIRNVPRSVVRCMVAASWNALLMAAAELVLEVLMLTDSIEKVEFRTGFTFLTLLSAVLGMHTLGDIIDDDLDTTTQALRITLLVEVGLVVADFEYVYTGGDEEETRGYYRYPFIVLTCVNLLLITFVTLRLKLLSRVCYVYLCHPQHRTVEPELELERVTEEKEP